MKYILNDILTISYKEYIEIKYSYKRLLLPLCVVFAPILFLTNTSNSILPLNVLALILPLLMAFCASSQLSIYTIIDEKQNNNLEVLLSLDISRLSIIIGKSIIPAIIGFILSIGCILVLKLVVIYSDKNILFNVRYDYLLMTMMICYLGAIISMFTSLLCPDIKVSPIYSMIVFVIVMFILYITIKTIGFYSGLLISIVFIISILMTIISSWMIKNKVSLITKL